MRSFKIIIILLTFLLLGFIPVHAEVTYTTSVPTNGSTVQTTDLNFTITFIPEQNVNSTCLSYLAISDDNSAFTNYLISNIYNLSADYYWTSSLSGKVYYKWLIQEHNATACSNTTESETYYFSVGIFASVILILLGVVSAIGGFLSIIIALIPVILVVVVIGMIKGWFKKGGILDFKGMLKMK